MEISTAYMSVDHQILRRSLNCTVIDSKKLFHDFLKSGFIGSKNCCSMWIYTHSP